MEHSNSLNESRYMEQRIYKTFVLFLIVLITGSAGYYIIFNGKERFIDCLYMTVITLSTVGYGEVLDISNNDVAKIFTMLLMMSGIGILAYGVSLVTAFLVEGELTDLIKRRRMNSKIAQLENHFIVCGIGETGRYALEEIVRSGQVAVAIEQDSERLHICKEQKIMYIQGDSTEDEILLGAGIKKATGLITALPSDKDNLFVTVTARQLNPNIRIIAKGIGEKMSDKLKKAGANTTVCPNFIGGLRMASQMIRPTVVVLLDMMLRDYQQPMRIEEITVQEDSPLANKTVISSGLKQKYNVLILAIADTNGAISFNPPPNTIITPGARVIVFGISSMIMEARKFAGNL